METVSSALKSIDNALIDKYSEEKGDPFNQNIVQESEHAKKQLEKELEYETIESISYVEISSKNRNISKYPNTNEYSIHFTDPLKNVKSIEIVKYNFPFKPNNIDEHNCYIDWEIKDGPTLSTRLEPHHYESIDAILDNLQNKMSEEHNKHFNIYELSKYSWFLDNNTMRTCFKYENDLYDKTKVRLLFRSGKNAYRSLNYILGFPKQDTEFTSSFQTTSLISLQTGNEDVKCVLLKSTEDVISRSILMKNKQFEQYHEEFTNMNCIKDELSVSESSIRVNVLEPFNTTEGYIKTMSHDANATDISYQVYHRGVHSEDVTGLYTHDHISNTLQIMRTQFTPGSEYSISNASHMFQNLIISKITNCGFLKYDPDPTDETFIADSKIYAYDVDDEGHGLLYMDVNLAGIENVAYKYGDVYQIVEITQFYDMTRISPLYHVYTMNGLFVNNQINYDVTTFDASQSASLNTIDNFWNNIGEKTKQFSDENTFYTARYQSLRIFHNLVDLDDAGAAINATRSTYLSNFRKINIDNPKRVYLYSKMLHPFKSGFSTPSGIEYNSSNKFIVFHISSLVSWNQIDAYAKGGLTSIDGKGVWGGTPTPYLHFSFYNTYDSTWTSRDYFLKYTPYTSHSNANALNPITDFNVSDFYEKEINQFKIDNQEFFVAHVDLNIENLLGDNLEAVDKESQHVQKDWNAILEVFYNLENYWDWRKRVVLDSSFTDSMYNKPMKPPLKSFETLQTKINNTRVLLPKSEQGVLQYYDNYIFQIRNPVSLFFKGSVESHMVRLLFFRRYSDTQFDVDSFMETLNNIPIDNEQYSMKVHSHITAPNKYDITSSNTIHVHTYELDNFQQNHLGIIYSGISNKLYDSKRIFNVIKQIPTLTFKFTRGDSGELYNFHNVEHSFILEVLHKNRYVKNFDENILH